MDWSIFSATFLTIFIAEMGDKTQFAAFAVASQSEAMFTVLLATLLALVLAGSLGVLAGSTIGHFVAPETMKIISGSAFILMGLWILLK